MNEILAWLVKTIGEPAVVAVLLAAALILVVMKHLYDKQHDFLLERLEVLRKENEDFQRRVGDLKQQMAAFESENQKLRSISTVLTEVSRELQDRPDLTREQLHAYGATLERFLSVQDQSFHRLIEAVEQTAPRRRMLEELQQIMNIMVKTQEEAQGNLHELRDRIRLLTGD